MNLAIWENLYHITRLSGGVESGTVPGWRLHFQARTLSAYAPEVSGTFAYTEPFDRV
jgi:hypothetical protein